MSSPAWSLSWRLASGSSATRRLSSLLPAASSFDGSTSAHVKGFGCRPFPDACRRAAPGPASESLQRRKPRVGRAPIRRRELWGFERRRRLLTRGRNDNQRRFGRIEHSQEMFSAGHGMIFLVAVVVGRSGRRIFERGPAARSNDQRQKRVALRRCGRRDRDHDVSILISPSEEPREARPRSNVSMTIMRPPQHGQGCARMRGSGRSSCWRGVVAASNSRARTTL